MRKVLGHGTRLVIEGIFVWALFKVSGLEAGEWLSCRALIILASAGIIAPVLWFPEIKDWLNPASRVYRRGVAQAERDKQERARRMINFVRCIPIARRPRYDDIGNFVEADIEPPKSIRHLVMHIATWLINHRVLPEGFYFWLGSRLGYKYRDNRAAHKETIDHPHDT